MFMMRSSSFPLSNPSPDFEIFKEVLLGRRLPEKVHFVELGIDYEVMRFIAEELMDIKPPKRIDLNEIKNRILAQGKDMWVLLEEEKEILKFTVEF